MPPLLQCESVYAVFVSVESPVGYVVKGIYGTGMTHANRSTAALKRLQISHQESSVRLAHPAKIPFERTREVAFKLHKLIAIFDCSSIRDAHNKLPLTGARGLKTGRFLRELSVLRFLQGFKSAPGADHPISLLMRARAVHADFG